MSKLHVMELFARAKQQQNDIDKIVKNSVDKKTEVAKEPEQSFITLKPLEKISYQNEPELDLKIPELSNFTTPEYMSEMSTISMLTEPATDRPVGRLVGSGGQFLALARPDGLWVIDMTTGLSNDSSTRSEICDSQIVDLHVVKNFIVFTDGINVGVAKCSPGVEVTRVVFLPQIAPEQDPVVHVVLHPVNSQFFAIVQKKKGWTLFDISRIQVRATTGAEPPTEGVFPILDISSNPIIAGKKLSPGVLAILKRGTSPEPKQQGEVNFVDFCFTSDGSFAAALLDNGTLKLWKIGYRCSTIESAKAVEKPMRDPRGLIPAGESNIAIYSDTEYVETDVYGTNRMRVKFRDSKILSVVSIDDHVRNFMIQSVEKNLVSVFLDLQNQCIKSSCFDPSSTDLVSVCSMVSVQSVGRQNQYNLYLNGENAEGCLVWSAQTIDIDEFHGSEVGFYGNGGNTPRDEVEDFIRSDASEQGPDEILPPNAFSTAIADVEEMLDHNKSFATFLSSIREDQETNLRELKSEMSLFVEKEIVAAIGKVQESQKVARRKEISQIRSETGRIIREKFRSSMTKTFAEIENQVVKTISSRFDDMNDKIVSSFSNSSLVSLSSKIDELTDLVDRELVRLRNGESAGPQPMADIRRYINGGDHVRAIEVAVHWWKSQTAVPAEDLLAITCAAIASQLKPAEPLVDIETGCYVLLVLTEWVKLNAGTHADRTVAVLRASRFMVGCLLVSPLTLTGEALELCAKSLSKSLRNIASGASSLDRSVEDQSRDLLTEIREIMMKFNIKTPSRSRDATPRTSLSPGTNILHMLQQAGSRR